MVRRSRARYHSAYDRIANSLTKRDWLANLLLRLSIGFMFFSGAVGKLGTSASSPRCSMALEFQMHRWLRPPWQSSNLLVAWR